MPANYYCILFDIDGTLLDFSAAEREAIEGTLGHFGLPATDDAVAAFSSINAALWHKLEQGEIKKDKLTVQRFAELLEKLGAEGDPVLMNNDFLTRLSKAAMPLPGAGEMLEELAEHCTIAAVSNGVLRVQLQRLDKSGLLKYFDGVFVSEKVGATKPNPRIFEYALKKLGIQNPKKVLMVGDSLGADIKGGINAKLDTCWCNFNGAENETGIIPTHTIRSYEELKLVAVGEEELKLAQLREKRHTV